MSGFDAFVVTVPTCPKCKGELQVDGPLGVCLECPETVFVIDPDYEPVPSKLVNMTDEEWETIWQYLGPKYTASFEPEVDLSEWLVRLHLCDSKTQGRTLIRQNAVKINGCVEDHDICLNHNEMIRGKWILLKKGKKHNFGLIKVKQADSQNVLYTSAKAPALP